MKIVRNINNNIFRGYDLRGIYGTDITEEVAYTIGLFFGSYIKENKKKVAVVGYDNRASSPSLAKALIDGIIASGIDVINLGLVTTPMYYYSWDLLNVYSGIMITASHNPKEYNGFKIAFDESGNAYGKKITDFRDYIKKGKYATGIGKVEYINIEKQYVKLIKRNLKFGEKKLKVVIDPGNGTTSIIIKKVIENLKNPNLDISYICDVSDSEYPNHHPDPSVIENNLMLINKVKEIDADIGIGFDGDGDRVGVIDEKGGFVPADIYLIIMWKYIFNSAKNKCALFDVKCTKAIEDEMIKLGGSFLRYRTGNSYMKAKMKEGKYSLAGELSGHIYFGDNFPGFDDGIYAGLKMVELLSNTSKSLSKLENEIDKYYSTPEIKIKQKEEDKYKLVEKVKKYAISKEYKINEIDGVMVEFEDGFFLIRASQTEPCVTIRMEAETQERLNEIIKEFEKIYRR